MFQDPSANWFLNLAEGSSGVETRAWFNNDPLREAHFGELDSDLEKRPGLRLWRFLIAIESRKRDDELIRRGE
jgi:hypothetical protein